MRHQLIKDKIISYLTITRHSEVVSDKEDDEVKWGFLLSLGEISRRKEYRFF